MAKYLSGTITSTYTLTVNPTTVTSAGTIDVNNSVAVYGPASAAWTVTNLGTVEDTGTRGAGVDLRAGGTVTNGASGSTAGLIEASRKGISISGSAGTITNYGTIESTGTGTSGHAIYLGAGGTVTNHGLLSGAQSGGPVSGTSGGYPGVIATRNQRATVTNLGTITNTNNSNGVSLDDGGLLINGSKSATSALISAPHSAVYMGGHLGVPTPGAIGTVVNYGTIRNTKTLGADVRLVSGGSVINHGLISTARTGISFGNTAGTVVNFGTVRSTAPTTSTAGVGIYLQSGGLITNAAGASITALRSAVGIGNTAATSAAAIVNNAGTITGSRGVSVGIADTGNNTITNSGRIIGTGGTAVRFGAGNDTLIVKSGAVFTGAVSGGGGTNTIIQGASGILTVTGFSAFETIRLANGGTDSLTLTGANFTGVGGNTITVDDGNSGNTIIASTLPATDRIVVHAGTGADALKGGAGNDIFYAGGKTTMTGGAGANQFTFAHIGTNTITDFSKSATNEIAFSNSGFKLGLSGATSTPHALPSSLIGSLTTGTFSNTKQRFAYKHSTGQLFFDSGGSGGTAHLVATLTGDPTLSAARLFFVT